ncbi:MAG: VIT domain-containing protein [Planctomycetota bacterium]|nr:VIT domain-containing protein [Planctomycetota bacterium]
MNHTAHHNDDFDGSDHQPPHDALDAKLRAWHETNRADATSSRTRILTASRKARTNIRSWVSVAALITMAVLIGVFTSPTGDRSAFAQGGIVMVPEGGRLDAFDGNGELIGPCPLSHTDVVADVSGPFSRVTVVQTYTNPYPNKIEAVYTFPLSHRGAVDRMTMRIKSADGERVVLGAVKERGQARQMYESARDSGYVASLLEQERPNIFTQSVANIEVGATVMIEISYVETLQSKDGMYSFDFPTVVGPRYIPGVPTGAQMEPGPMGTHTRCGTVLLAPASVEMEISEGSITAAELLKQLETAVATTAPSDESIESIEEQDDGGQQFTVTYANQSQETGIIIPSKGCGQIGSRWFKLPKAGAAFSSGTDQVPDANRITPMPVPPTTRAGHDISIRVNVDTGGPAITGISSSLHQVVEDLNTSPGVLTKRSVSLVGGSTIPNRDFVLTWRVADDTIVEGFFSNANPIASPTSQGDSASRSNTDGYFTLVLSPPGRIESAQVRARELVFVLDTSGSMSGFPMEKSKELMTKALAAMRPQDTFNIITFAGSTRILWPTCKTGSLQNVEEAMRFVSTVEGRGGTEMMTAINTALVQTAGGGYLSPTQLADLPADGRSVAVATPFESFGQDGSGAMFLTVRDGLRIPIVTGTSMPTVLNPVGVVLHLDGTWSTVSGQRVFQVSKAAFANDAATPLRVVVFLTDAYVGNDQAIVQSIRENAKSTRVFSLGIGNSVNRWLIDAMAQAGRGASEVVLLTDNADEAVSRLVRRIQTPVLTNITVEYEGIAVSEVAPAGNEIPDLFDASPLVLSGRFNQSAIGAIVVRGQTPAGPWERRINVTLPAHEARNDFCKSIWARARVDQLVAPYLAEVERQSTPAEVWKQIVSIGEKYSIMTPFTSFIAIESARVTVGGKAMLVAVPIELPQGTRWEGFFGSTRDRGEFDESAQLVAPTSPPMTAAPMVKGGFSVLHSKHKMRGAQGMEPSNGRAMPRRSGFGGTGGGGSSGGGSGGGVIGELRDPSRTRFADALEQSDKEGDLPTLPKPIHKIYDVRDLVHTTTSTSEESEKESVELTKSLEDSVEPTIWSDRGGTSATLQMKRGLVQVLAEATVHDEIAAFFAAKRTANRSEAEVLSSESLDQLWTRLDEGLLFLALYGDRPDPITWTESDGELSIAIRAQVVDAPLRARLKAAGMTIDAESIASRTLVGHARAKDLTHIALTDGVERVQPMQASPDVIASRN